MKKEAIIVGLAIVALIVIGSISVTGFATKLVSLTSSCEDTDGGIEFDTKGTVTYAFRGSDRVLEDECFDRATWWKADDILLREYSCGDKRAVATSHKCDGECSDGACVSA
jgi:hypothetical protein